MIHIDWPPKIPRGFPLTVHTRGYVKSGLGWICGKRSPEEALKIYHEKAQAKLNRRPPRITITTGDEQTVAQLAERYVHVRLEDATAGEIEMNSYRQIENAVVMLLEHVVSADVPVIGGDKLANARICDLCPDHFSDFAKSMREQGGEAFARKKCRLMVGLFKHAAEEDWISHPVKMGRRFRQVAWSKPHPIKSIPPTPAEVRKLLRHIDSHLAKYADRKSKRGNVFDLRGWRQFRAGVLMAVNGGYGSSELAQMPRGIVDLDAAVIDYRRGKTGKDHVVPLWPETVAAIQAVFADADRTRPGDDLVFRTREGRPWAFELPKLDEYGGLIHVSTVDNFGQWFAKLARKTKIKRPNQSFYSLKDLHCSIADEQTDQPAAYRLTGHQYHTGGRDPYVTVTLDRLRKVVEFIRQRVILPDGPSAVLPGDDPKAS